MLLQAEQTRSHGAVPAAPAPADCRRPAEVTTNRCDRHDGSVAPDAAICRRSRERLVRLGATVVRWDTEHVMLDPEGNEFCLSGPNQR
jgi:Glyoxalase-like domain